MFHPGDALTVPDEPVATLLLPLHAPWSRTAELIDYVRAVHADQAFAVHDGLLNDTGLGVVGGLLGERGPGTPDAVQPAGPGGLGRALRARPRPPGAGSADGARCDRPETPSATPISSTAATTARMKPSDVQLEDVGARR